MTTTDKPFIRCVDLFDDWADDVLHGEPPTRYDAGPGLDHFRLSPGTVTLLGGAPGMGKTAFIMQAVVTAMVHHDDLRVCVANVEMPPERLLERQLSRLSDVPLDDIQGRNLSASQADDLSPALETIEDIADRLMFVRGPMTLENVAAAADAIDAGVIVLDYIQRIRPAGRHDDKRGAVDETMGFIRQFADAGLAVVALSAVGRSKDKKGRSSYAGDGLSLASFKESGELEYGADDAFLIVPVGETGDDAVVDVELRQPKSRYGKPTDITMSFDRSRQRFDVDGIEGSETAGGGGVDLASLWEDVE